MLASQFSEVKVFYDQNGQPQQVLISYDLYRTIQRLLESLGADRNQGYFWSDEWQTRMDEGEKDVYA